jgi:hypothetical protein
MNKYNSQKKSKNIVSPMDNVTNWITEKGKYVQLVEPDMPWYIVKNQNREPKGIVHTKQKLLNEVEYRDNANYKTNFVLDVTRPDMGYGHKYSDRGGEPCKCDSDCSDISKNIYEGFSVNTFTFRNNKLVYLLILMAGLMIFYKMSRK